MARDRRRPKRPSADTTAAADAAAWRQGRAAFAKGRYPSALQAWARCQRPEAAAARAEAHLRLGLAATRPDEAVAAMRAAVHLAPRDARYAYHLGLALWRAGDLVQARPALERAVELDPAEPRFRRHARLVAALCGQGTAERGDAWRAALWRACRDGHLPEQLPGAPGWVGAVFKGLQELASGDGEAAVAAAQQGLTRTDLPAEGADILRWCALRGASLAGRWDFVLQAQPLGRRGSTREEAALRRTAAAQLVLASLSIGDAEAATVAWASLGAAAGLPGEVYDRVEVRLGEAWARNGNWSAAAQRWMAVADRLPLEQPLALACERFGHPTSARRWWERVATQVQRGRWAAADTLPPGRLLAAVERHVAELARERGEFGVQLRYLTRALDHHPEPPVAWWLELARAWGRSQNGPGRDWEPVINAYREVTKRDPECDEAWGGLAAALRGSGHYPEAAAARQRWLRFDPGDAQRRDALLEDTGRAVLTALMAKDAAAIERLADGLDAMPRSGGLRGSWPGLMGILARSLALRLGGSRRTAAALTPLEPYFRGSPGESAPVVAFVLRGVLAELAGSSRKAEDLFQQTLDPELWNEEDPFGGLDIAGHIAYEEWIGWSVLWAQRLRRRRPETLADIGPGEHFWQWLAMAAAERKAFGLGPRASPRLPPVPPLVAGVGRVEEVYAHIMNLLGRDLADMLGPLPGAFEFDDDDDDDDDEFDEDEPEKRVASPSEALPFFGPRPRRRGARRL